MVATQFQPPQMSEEARDDELPKLAASLRPASEDPLLEMWNVRKYFPIRGGIVSSHIGDVRAVDGVSFPIHKGETVGLVGESGCGKTTVGRLILRLIEPTSGHALIHTPKEVAMRTSELYVQLNAMRLASGGLSDPRAVERLPQAQPLLRELDQIAQKYSIYRMKPSALRKLRGKLQIVFQDPFSSLSPRMLVRDIVAEPMAIHHIGNKAMRYQRVSQIMQEVGLNVEHLWRFPHEFSGGQRQRIGIARALVLEPEFIVLDEPTSALDVSVQAQVLNILLKLQHEHNLAYLFISHHLSVVRSVSHRVVVMYLGEVVETALTENLFSHPFHPYTQALLSAIPIPDPALKRNRMILKGDVPSPAAPPSGCRFHTRCPMVMDICSKISPPLLPVKGGSSHLVACHLYTVGTAPSIRSGTLTHLMGARGDIAMLEGTTASFPYSTPSPPASLQAGYFQPTRPQPPALAPLPSNPSALPPQEFAPPPPTAPSTPTASPESTSPASTTSAELPLANSPTAPRPRSPLTPTWRSHPLLEHALSTDSTLSPSLGHSIKDRFKRGSG